MPFSQSETAERCECPFWAHVHPFQSVVVEHFSQEAVREAKLFQLHLAFFIYLQFGGKELWGAPRLGTTFEEFKLHGEDCLDVPEGVKVLEGVLGAPGVLGPVEGVDGQLERASSLLTLDIRSLFKVLNQ